MLFVQKHLSSMFGKVVNMLLNWLPKLRVFHSKSIWISNVVDNMLLGKARKKEPNEIQNCWTKNNFKELIHKFWNLTLRNQMLADMIEIFQNLYHVHLHFTWRRREFFLHTIHLLWFLAVVYSETLQISKMECFCVSVNCLRKNTPSWMGFWICAFRFYLIMFCAIITNIWWDISNTYIARG